VLDPVSAGVTRCRDQALRELLAAGSPTVIRGNASEVRSVAGLAAATCGVDSAAASNDGLQAARVLSDARQCMVCVSGADDHDLDAQARWATPSNGHSWMTRVTALGCSASPTVDAFFAVQRAPWRATVAAMACLSVAGELAVERVQAAGVGVGRLQIEQLDALQLQDGDAFSARLSLRVHV
jgi:hydroxyethylthiazole kinase